MIINQKDEEDRYEKKNCLWVFISPRPLPPIKTKLIYSWDEQFESTVHEIVIQIF